MHFLLWHDLSWLHIEWAEFRELFGTKPSRIDLMNETAPAFFGQLQEVMLESVLLCLTRLTDPPRIGGHDNLTFLRLPRRVAGLTIQGAVHQALGHLIAATHFARDWRDRRLAHRDLGHALDPTAKPLAPASRADVEAALAAARELMGVTEVHFTNTTVRYEQVVRTTGGAWDLLYQLESGLEAVRARREGHVQWKPKYL
ncbi:MAG TPA: hypothetical protein VGR09_09515 [Gemmatimonadales bacterium]|nr:hypothetical protein [Gemmatimonadales bacterium]